MHFRNAGGAEMHLHPFLAPVLDGGECTISRSGRYTPGTYWIEVWVGLRVDLDVLEKPCSSTTEVFWCHVVLFQTHMWSGDCYLPVTWGQRNYEMVTLMNFSERVNNRRSAGLWMRLKSRSKLETESGYGLFPAKRKSGKIHKQLQWNGFVNIKMIQGKYWRAQV